MAMPSSRWALIVTVGVIVAAGFAVGLWVLLSLGTIDEDSDGADRTVGGNGAFITRTFSGSQVEVLRYPLDDQGSIGEPALVYAGPGQERTGPGVVDGVGLWVLMGSYLDGPYTDLQVRSADDGALLHSIDEGGWCGGEGPDLLLCVLLDGERVARTTAIAPGMHLEASVLVSSLADGRTLAEYGPFAGLEGVLGTPSAGTVLLVLAEGAGGQVLSLDVATGRTSAIGPFEAGWLPLCAVGTDAALGVQWSAATLTLRAVGATAAADVSWSADSGPGLGFEAVGCSADGRFVYLMDAVDGDAGARRVLIDRITVADGVRERVLDSGQPGPEVWTR